MEYLTQEEACKYMKIHRTRLYYLVRDKIIPYYTPYGKNGKKLFKKSELQEFIENAKV